jgi:hypothetical protein
MIKRSDWWWATFRKVITAALIVAANYANYIVKALPGGFTLFHFNTVCKEIVDRITKS